MTAIAQELDPEVLAALPSGDEVSIPQEWQKGLLALERLKESPSSIRTYLSCPLRWYLERYSDLPGEPSGFPAVVGSFVHRVLEVFYNEPSHLRTERLLTDTFRTAWEHMKQRVDDGLIPYGLQEDFDLLVAQEADDASIDRLYGRFYKRSRACIEAVPEFDGDPAALDVVGNELWVVMDRRGVLVRGKIDRVVRTRTGGVVVQDWKTGRAPSEDEPVDVLSDTYVPLGLYSLMMSEVGSEDVPPCRVVGAQLLYLGASAKYTSRVDDDVLGKVGSLVDSVLEGMKAVRQTGRVVVQPAESPAEGQCSWCPASGICPAWTDGTFDGVHSALGI